MYRLVPIKEQYRDVPWKMPYELRIDTLKRGKIYGQKTIAFIYPKFDSSTFRYRGYNVAETLDCSIKWKGACFEQGEINRLSEDINLVDVVVLIRCAWMYEFDNFICKVRELGIRLCYDVDDLIYDPKYMRNVMEAIGLSSDSEFDFWSGLTERYNMLITQCDAVITTNKYLADYLRQDLEKDCYIIPNYLNWIQEDVSQVYFEQKQKIKAVKPFIIGYFSGSPTHVKDLMLIMPEVEEFLRRHKDSLFRIVGYMDIPQEYNQLVDDNRIEFVPFQSFIGLQYEQALVDVNVVPLVTSTFANCKSELKYFESAIVGTITCATPTFTYAHAIETGKNGYLCEQGEWLQAFEKIYKEGVEPERQKAIRDCALERYSYRNMIAKIEEIFGFMYGG